jgi:hypothetical protein
MVKQRLNTAVGRTPKDWGSAERGLEVHYLSVIHVFIYLFILA